LSGRTVSKRKKLSAIKSAPSTTPARLRPWWVWPLGVALSSLLLSWLLYSRVLGGGFVFDDLEIASSRLLQARTWGDLVPILSKPGIPRRVGRVSLALNHMYGALEPYGYHAVGIVLHGLNGLLVFLLLRWLLAHVLPERASPERRDWLAAAGSALWLVHPIHTQAVSYIWQRTTVLVTFLYLCSLLAFLHGRERQGRGRVIWFGISATLGLAALATKENAATLPVVMVLLARLAPRANGGGIRHGRWLLAGLGTFVLVAAFYLGPRFLELMSGEFERRGFTLTERLLTESRVVVMYLSLLVWPHPSRLRLEYDYTVSQGLLTPATTLTCLALIAALLVAAVWQWRKRPWLALGILWYFVHLAIESSVVPLDLVYEHRLYLPSIVPLGILACLLLERVLTTRAWRLSFLAPLLVFALWSHERNAYWADPVRLLADNAAKTPNKARVWANYGKALLDRGATESAQWALERARALDPDLAAPHHNLAALHLFQRRDAQGALAVLEAWANRRTPDMRTHVNLGTTLMALERWREAAEHFEHAARLRGNDLSREEERRLAAQLTLAWQRAGDPQRAVAARDSLFPASD
jgi:protein O-mannosyl-transferase